MDIRCKVEGLYSHVNLSKVDKLFIQINVLNSWLFFDKKNRIINQKNFNKIIRQN